MSNRGRHKKSINTSIEKLLETIKKNNHSYRARIKLFRNGKLHYDTTAILNFNTKKDILNWLCNIKFLFSIDTITIDKHVFKL